MMDVEFLMKLKTEGSQLATNCSQLKMKAEDRKIGLTDVADTEEILSLIQLIPSLKWSHLKGGQLVNDFAKWLLETY